LTLDQHHNIHYL